MSEFIAEAQVLVKPDTTKFRAQLQAQLKAATKGVVVPITVVPSKTGAAASGFAALTAAQNGVKKSTKDVEGALTTLNGKTKKTTAELLGAGSATARLDSALLGLRTAIGSSAVIGLGALALAAIVAGKAIRASILNFASFEQELNTFQAVSEATASQMEAVRAEAARLGEDVKLPAVSAADAAVAMTELAKAGLTVEEAMAGAEGVLQLATAAQISNAEASQIAANALNSFGLEGDQAIRVADDLANAANAAQGSISDFGLAFRQASAVAKQVGLSLEDTTAILALFAKNGLQGSDAGTSLRVALIKLVAPTKQARAEIQKLGLDLRDAQGNLRADIFAQFGEATRNLAPAARDAAAALIFGQDAIRAVSIGAREGAEGLRVMQFEIDQQGTAAEVAAARTEGLAGSLGALQSAAQTLSISFGGVLSKGISNVADALTSLITITDQTITALGKLDAEVDKFFEGLPGGGGTKSFLDEAFSFFATPGKALSESLKLDVRDIFTGTDQAKAQLKGLNDELQALQTARIGAEKGGQSSIADQLTKEINGVRDEIKALKADSQGLSSDVTAPLQKAVEELQKVRDTKISLGVDTSGVDRLIASLQKSIPITQQVEGNINRLRDDVGDLGTKAQNSAGGVDALTRALAGLGRQSAQTQAELLKIQSEGGTPQQQIGLLQADIQTQREIIKQQQARGGASGSATAIKKAREQIIQEQNEIESLQAGLVSDQKAAASAAEKSAKEAQDARDKQFQALAELFGGRQTNIENQIARAGIAGNVSKQINLTKDLIASLKKERDALVARLKAFKVSNEVRKRILQAITAAIESAQQDILRLNKEQADNIKEFATPAIDLRIRIAQARDNVAAEIRLRRERLALISKELARLKNAGKKNTLAWLDLKAQQAEEAAAIRELQKTTEDKNKAQKGAFFSFLQTQQGFAANLLGNLIPGFATGGLVGGSTPTPGQPMLAGPDDRARATADVGATRAAGVRPVQVDRTNHILEQILAALRGGQPRPPEATFNYSAGKAIGDIF